MLSIAVCDDEVMECCNIAEKVKEILTELKISSMIRQFYSGQELMQSPDHFDIIFLDIIMRDMDGMRTAQMIREKAFDKILIFISSSRKFALEAYDVEAFWYLLKPIDEKKLKRVLQKAIFKMQQSSQEFMIVSKERQKQKLFLDNICYFEIKGRQIDVHEINGIFTYYEKISVLENNLQGKGFFRCHKSYLINLKHVDVYNRQEVTLDNGEKIVIAKRRYDAFCQEILAYMRKNGGLI
jgi:Response regulator of the LytR/AlgR family